LLHNKPLAEQILFTSEAVWWITGILEKQISFPYQTSNQHFSVLQPISWTCRFLIHINKFDAFNIILSRHYGCWTCSQTAGDYTNGHMAWA
jgi:hypothetical protein